MSVGWKLAPPWAEDARDAKFRRTEEEEDRFVWFCL
jgi:hypothetical protein